VLRTLEKVLRHELELHFPQSSREERDAAVEEWYALAVCGDQHALQTEPLEYYSLLKSFAAMFARARKLPADAQWNDIVLNGLKQFDDLISQGVQSGWSWRRILEVHTGNTLINLAFRKGVGPDLPEQQLVSVLVQDVAKRSALGRETQDVHETLVSQGLNGAFFAKMQKLLVNLWGRNPSSITKEEIEQFVNEEPHQEGSSDW
jgi:hypothetical protein